MIHFDQTDSDAEVVWRDRHHGPRCLIGWCKLNESITAGAPMTTTTIALHQVGGFDASKFDAIFLRPPQGSDRLVFSTLVAEPVVPGAKLSIPDHNELLIEVPDSHDAETFNLVKRSLLPTTGLDGWHQN